MTHFITDKKTNSVCFSTLLTQFKFWKQLEQLLKNNQINYELIPHTKDIWMRDFLPIQIKEHIFVKFGYRPSYLKKLKEYHTTNFERCILSYHQSIGNHQFIHRYTRPYPCLEINLDGGNVISCDNQVIISDRVFQENKSWTKNKLLSHLETKFEREIIVIPSDPTELTGHADGMVRYIGHEKILLNHYVDFDRDLRNRLLKILTPHFSVIELHLNSNACPATNWSYINYLQVGDFIVAPTLKKQLDDVAIPQLEAALEKHVHTLPILGALRIGGGLNCFSWTTQGPVDQIWHDDFHGNI